MRKETSQSRASEVLSNAVLRCLAQAVLSEGEQQLSTGDSGALRPSECDVTQADPDITSLARELLQALPEHNYTTTEAFPFQKTKS